MTEQKDKYGNLDELLGGADAVSVSNRSRPPRRRKTASPALDAMTGGKKAPRLVDELKAEKEAAQQALVDARSQFDEEKQALEAKVAELLKDGHVGSPALQISMPVTKQPVNFTLQEIDPEIIDVSRENERIQSFLDEISLSDILPSIRKDGQQKPGTIRPAGNGRYELIEGSRRLASVKLLGKPYLAFVGEVPDADVRELSLIENRHRDVSPYEKAKAFQRQLEAGEFNSWAQLGSIKSISDSHINRYKKAAELDELFVKILPSPSDMTLAYADDLSRLLGKNEDSREKLISTAEVLLQQRADAMKRNAEPLDADSIFRALKSAVRNKPKLPTQKRPVKYSSKDGKVALKHSLSASGTTKFELSGLKEKEIATLLEMVKKQLQLR
jgi:ParB family chromosome partitioning protein